MASGVPIPPAQAKRFQLLMCEELGIKPSAVREISASSTGEVTAEFYVEPDRLVELFNLSAQ